MRKILSLLLVLSSSICLFANAQKYAAFQPGPDRTVIVKDGKIATIFLDSQNEWTGVKWAAESLSEDFERVVGRKAPIAEISKDRRGNILPIEASIIVGTIDRGGLIENFLNEDDILSLKGKREKYILKTSGSNVIIAGSDKRGTTYGIYALSSSIGVSPWYWWADVPSEKHNEIYILNGNYTEGEAKVFYRGIFLNDEAPALTGWVKENTDGYKSGFYKRVFELILRLKGNFMWPAMWDAAFYDDDPLNMYFADTMGIIMSTSHHEPCSRAQKEWSRYGNNIWDYTKNKKVLDNFWFEGIKRMKDTEDVVTIGMRGDGDMAMEEGTNIALLEKIVREQRKLIEKATGRPASETPQVWALYKEVQDYYDKGMKVPDDVTLLYCDDNWGNVRKLPNLEDKPRKGGYGMYYHFDYVGAPRNSKWLNCNQVERTYEQMNLCYQYGIRKLWVVNVGDLKPMEYPIQFWFDMAWDPEAITPDTIFNHTVSFAKDNFGDDLGEEIAKIIQLYSKYSRRITPELLTAKTYTFDYDEWPSRVKEWNELEVRALRVYQKLSPEYYDAYEQLVLFPVQAMQNVYEMYYSAAMNQNSENPTDINYWAARTKELYNRDAELCYHYNHEIANGKWNHFMDQNHIGYFMWQEPREQKMPKVDTYEGPGFVCHQEEDGYVSIEAGNFAVNNNVTVIPELGRTQCGLTTFPVTQAPENAYVEYSLQTLTNGEAELQILLAPTLNFNANKGLRYAVSVDGGEEVIVNFNGHYKGELGKWQADCIIYSNLKLDFGQSGRHTLRFRFIDPGIVLEKILVDFGGLKPSYLGAPSSLLIK